MIPRRTGFTLFELILSMALAGTLLALIGTAINLYLTRVDADRTRVEEAQLARSVLAMIADDIRAATVYQKQDTAAIAQLMAAGKPFDVDSIDKARQAATGMGGTSSAGTVAKLSALASGSGGGSSGSSSGGTSSGGASSGSGSGEGSGDEESDQTMPLGLTGTAQDLYVDVTRFPQQDELFNTITGYTNAKSPASSKPGAAGPSTGSSDTNAPSDLKTVHYYIRSGNAVEAGSTAVTSLAPEAQASAGGLVRQAVSRRERVFSEQVGTGGSQSTPEQLIAPEAVQISFRYFDGSQLVDQWDMKELKKLPTAIEVCVWLQSPQSGGALAYGSSASLASAHQYRQVVYLPMSQVSDANAASATDSSSTSTTDSSSSSSSSDSSSGSSTGTGSAFGEQ